MHFDKKNLNTDAAKKKYGVSIYLILCMNKGYLDAIRMNLCRYFCHAGGKFCVICYFSYLDIRRLLKRRACQQLHTLVNRRNKIYDFSFRIFNAGGSRTLCCHIYQIVPGWLWIKTRRSLFKREMDTFVDRARAGWGQPELSHCILVKGQFTVCPSATGLDLSWHKLSYRYT